MPIILVIIGVIAALGLGGYFWETSRNDVVTPTSTPTGVPPGRSPEIPAPVTTTPSPTTTPTPVAAEPTPTPVTPSPTPTPTPAPVTPKTAYKDGTYKVDVSYGAPDGGDHGVTVSLTIKSDTVTASDVAFAESAGPTANFQGRFSSTYKSLVIGQPLSVIKLSRVAGASLTTNAWNDAQAKITAQAKS